MSQYKAIYINEKKEFKPYETIELEFILIDKSTNSLITTFTNYTIKCEIENDSDEKKYDNADTGGVTTSNGIILVTIPKTDTDDFTTDTYLNVELAIVVGGEQFIVYSGKIYIKEEIIDW